MCNFSSTFHVSIIFNYTTFHKVTMSFLYKFYESKYHVKLFIIYWLVHQYGLNYTYKGKTVKLAQNIVQRLINKLTSSCIQIKFHEYCATPVPRYRYCFKTSKVTILYTKGIVKAANIGGRK